MMRSSLLCALFSLAIFSTGARPLDAAFSQVAMALPNSPSGGYAPAVVPCPDARPAVRSASTLSPEEASWLAQRRTATVQPMIDFLQRADITGFDAQSFINSVSNNASAFPNIAIAVSGGGYRAMLNGAGFLAAADDRTPGATDQGGIGGLLQAATYLSGLSGGGWLVGSIYTNNFSSVVDLRDGSKGSSIWQLDSSIFEGPQQAGLSILDTASYWEDIWDAVSDKSDAGFDVSLTDYWGRALSYQLVNATDGGPAYTFSSIADMDDFEQAQIPFPILVSDGRDPGTSIVSVNSTVFEFNAFEMGSWDPTVFGFVPTEYIGSNFVNGSIPSDGQCVRGFDQSGFVMGTSSSLFNQILAYNISEYVNVPSFVADAIEAIVESLDELDLDIAKYVPNPFRGYNPATNPLADSDQLSLVDGGEDLQNIPFVPLIQPERAVDIIFAVDSSADTTTNWPNGTSMRATYDRAQSAMANGTLFPPVPDANTFVNEGFNSRPTFFGCNASNFTLSAGQAVPPLVVYVPNAPYTDLSNVSTFDPAYSDTQRDDMIRNGYNAATQGNATLDAAWPACVACAVLSRSFDRTGTAVPSVCQDCFQRYCWDGTLNTTDAGPYEPTFKIGNERRRSESGAAGPGRGNGRWLPVVVAAFAAVLIL